MRIPNPDHLFDRLHLPGASVWAWRVGAGAGLVGAAVIIAIGHFWVAAVLLLAGVLAAGVGEAMARRTGAAALPVLPGRALAAMFLMLALSVLSVLGRGHAAAVTWLIGAVFLLACIFPNYFSLLAYIIGVIAFLAAGQGAVRDRV